MSHIVVGFSTKRGSILGFLTRLFTRWKHSHVVLISDDGKSLIEATDDGGVREMPISYLMGRDDVEIRQIPHPFPSLVWLHAKTQLGAPYDNTYSFGWLLDRDWQEEGAWACTELIEWACRRAGHALFPLATNYLSPRDLYLISEEVEDEH